jgi:hypothetical protein
MAFFNIQINGKVPKKPADTHYSMKKTGCRDVDLAATLTATQSIFMRAVHQVYLCM